MSDNEMLKLADKVDRVARMMRKIIADVPFHDQDAADLESGAKALRAAASAEPVAWRWRSVFNDSSWCYGPVEPTAHDQYVTEPLYTHPAPDAEIGAALETGRRYIVGYYNAALMSYDSAKAFEHNAELQKIDAALTKAKGGSPDAVIKKTPGPELKVKR